MCRHKNNPLFSKAKIDSWFNSIGTRHTNQLWNARKQRYSIVCFELWNAHFWHFWEPFGLNRQAKGKSTFWAFHNRIFWLENSALWSMILVLVDQVTLPSSQDSFHWSLLRPDLKKEKPFHLFHGHHFLCDQLIKEGKTFVFDFIWTTHCGKFNKVIISFWAEITTSDCTTDILFKQISWSRSKNYLIIIKLLVVSCLCH